MEFCGASAGRKEFTVDGLLADIGTGVVLEIRSSPLATGRPVLTCTGIEPVALGFVENFLDKVPVLNRTQIVDSQMSLYCRQIPCL